MAGTETGMKWLERKIRSLRAPDSDEAKITQTEAYEPKTPVKFVGLDEFNPELRKASFDKRMNTAQEVDEIRDAVEKARAEKKGVSVQQMRKNMSDEYDRKMKAGEFYKKGGSVKGWGAARGARKAKVY